MILILIPSCPLAKLLSSYDNWFNILTCNSHLALELQLPMQSVPIIPNVVSSNPAHGEGYSVQDYAQSWWFSLCTPVSSINKTELHDITEVLFKAELITITLTLTLTLTLAQYLALYCICMYVLAYLTTVGYISEVNIHRAYHPLVTHNLHVRAKPLIKLPLPGTSVNIYYNIKIASGGRHGYDRMVVGLIYIYAISAYHH